MLKFSTGHKQKKKKKKKNRFFSDINWVIYLSCPLKGFFFSIFSSGNHFVQQSKTIYFSNSGKGA